jgi:hypothetical protein
MISYSTGDPTASHRPDPRDDFYSIGDPTGYYAGVRRTHHRRNPGVAAIAAPGAAAIARPSRGGRGSRARGSPADAITERRRGGWRAATIARLVSRTRAATLD